MTCFFVTLLCWDMAGDKDGWSQALWVVVVGVVMALVIWVCDRLMSWPPHVSSLSSADHPLFPSTLPADTQQSFELVHSSLHQRPPAAAGPDDSFHD
jgi:hypothetical protein